MGSCISVQGYRSCLSPALSYNRDGTSCDSNTNSEGLDDIHSLTIV
jgi:hypothetical protein